MKKESNPVLQCLFDETYKPDRGWLVVRFCIDLEFQNLETNEFISTLKLANNKLEKVVEAIKNLEFKMAEISDNDMKWHTTGCGEIELAIFLDMKNNKQNEQLFSELKKLGFEKWNN